MESNPALACGIHRHEGLLVAYIPPTDSVPQEYEYRDGKRTFTLVAYDGIVLDMMPHDNKACKWWLVRQAARQEKLAQIEPIWTGPAEDFHITCLPELPREPGYRLAMRQFSRGPWILLEKETNGQLQLALGNHPAEPRQPESVCIS